MEVQFLSISFWIEEGKLMRIMIDDDFEILLHFEAAILLE